MWRCLWMLGALGGAVVAAMRDECPPRSCTSPSAYRARPVCGSNGITYNTQCALDRVRCESNPNLVIARRGRCKDTKPCISGLVYSQLHSSEDFRPQCKPDGSYSPVQCTRDYEHCWCVTPSGQPLPNISVKRNHSGKPRCVITEKSMPRRRSSPRNKKSKRNCKRVDKAIFNNNLIKIFVTEMSRETQIGLPGGDRDRSALEWKFRKMDLDQSGSLDKTEYRDLRRIVKKIVKPKRCAKSFARACDMDRDQIINRQEWAECLTKEGMDDVREEDSDTTDQDEDDDDEGDDLLSSGSPRSPPPHGVLQGSVTFTSSSQNYNDESGERRDEDATDCLSDRQAVLNEQRADKLYVPECTPDGRYQKVQCYKSAGYCWCVHEDTGKNIPGTSVKNQTPKCDQVPAPSRPMKGCPEPKKTSFLKELMALLLIRMAKETNGTNITGSIGSSWKASKEEQVATWNFVVLDKNKNKVLERNEWKAFRDMVADVKSLRRCGRKLPRYCDINHDRRISMTEWLDCLNAQRSITEQGKYLQVMTTVSPGSARTGRNPLSLLMED